MSVYIKGMEMPPGCRKCELMYFDGETDVCPFAGEVFPSDVERSDYCPLVPVPPHGRLGDLDRLAEKIHECWDAYPADAFCEDFLDEMPTIIPEEEGET